MTGFWSEEAHGRYDFKFEAEKVCVEMEVVKKQYVNAYCSCRVEKISVDDECYQYQSDFEI